MTYPVLVFLDFDAQNTPEQPYPLPDSSALRMKWSLLKSAHLKDRRMRILKFGYKKELLDFTKGWVTVESDMIPQNKTCNGLSSPLKNDNDQLVIDNILKEMIVCDKLELEMGSE